MPCPVIAVLFLFLLVAALVPALKLLRSRFAFSRAEVITIYIMMLTGAVVVTDGFSGSFLTVITGAVYYATPENRWLELFAPNTHPWLVPDDRDAVRWFYEGLPTGMGIPWSAWARPLAAWIPFLLLFYWVLFCVGVLLRGQWVENDRLVFPLTRLPLAMTEDVDDGGRLVERLLKHPLLWLGFSIPLLFHSWNGLGFLLRRLSEDPGRRRPPAAARRSARAVSAQPSVIGLAWLVPLGISFSIWFFHALGVLQEWILKRIGISVGSLDVWDSGGSPISILHEQAGALAVLCFFVLWTARGIFGSCSGQLCGAIGESGRPWRPESP